MLCLLQLSITWVYQLLVCVYIYTHTCIYVYYVVTTCCFLHPLPLITFALQFKFCIYLIISCKCTHSISITCSITLLNSNFLNIMTLCIFTDYVPFFVYRLFNVEHVVYTWVSFLKPILLCKNTSSTVLQSPLFTVSEVTTSNIHNVNAPIIISHWSLYLNSGFNSIFQDFGIVVFPSIK